MARKVNDPRGGTWTIRRRRLLRRRRLRAFMLTQRGPAVVGIGMFQLLLFLPFLLIYLVQTAYDGVRSFLAHWRGAPYVIEATRSSLRRDVLVWRVSGRDRSKQALSEAAAALARGDELTSFGEPERSVMGDASAAHHTSLR